MNKEIAFKVLQVRLFELVLFLEKVFTEELFTILAKFVARDYLNHILWINRINIISLARCCLLEKSQYRLLIYLWLKMLEKLRELVKLHDSIPIVIILLYQLLDNLSLLVLVRVPLSQDKIDESLLTDQVIM